MSDPLWPRGPWRDVWAERLGVILLVMLALASVAAFVLVAVS